MDNSIEINDFWIKYVNCAEPIKFGIKSNSQGSEIFILPEI